ncbi:MAG: hypothetical protein ACT4P1_12385 [Sporichthyaceae bacterium]
MSEALHPGPGTPTPPPLPTPAATGTAATSAFAVPSGFACVNCGGARHFTPATKGTTCIQCGSAYPIEPDPATAPEHDLAAGLADPRAGAGGGQGAPSVPAPGGQPDTEFVCPSCHGVVGFTGTLTATRCPFCAHPVQTSDVRVAPDRFAVDGIVPFGLDQKAAETHVRTWITKRRWAPNAFKKYATTGSFAGIYLPFFTFDADTHTAYDGARGTDRTRTVRRNGKTETERYIDWDSVSGDVTLNLDDVPVTAESSVDAKRMRELEPWPTDTAQTFQPEYLAGFLARRYDRSLAHCQIDARNRMNDLIDDAIKRDIGGDHQRISSKDTAWSNESFRHLLLPVFLLVVLFKSKPYQVAVNGVTGEVHGKRPWSWVKIGAAVLAGLLVASVIGVYAWKSQDETTSTGTSFDSPGLLPPGLTAQQLTQLAEVDSEPSALSAPPEPLVREFPRQNCVNAVVAYRLRTPDTYFPVVAACEELDPAERLRIARDLFEQDQISDARKAVIALGDTPASRRSTTQTCRAELALAGAKIAANEDAPADGRGVAQACDGLPEATINRLSDGVADDYVARRKEALADAR